jgi:hypothetical protein
LKKSQADKRDPYLALLTWRNTPTEGLNSSPVQRLMGRRTRTPLPTSANLLKPKLPCMVKEQVTNKRRKQARYYNRGSKPLPELKPGDVVRIRPDPNSSYKTWRSGVCNEKVAPRSYEVTSDGKLYRRNRRNLAATTERVEEKATLPDEKSELYGSTFQNNLPAAQDNPLQEVSTDSSMQTNQPLSNEGKPSNPVEKRSSRGRLLKARLLSLMTIFCTLLVIDFRFFSLTI